MKLIRFAVLTFLLVSWSVRVTVACEGCGTSCEGACVCGCGGSSTGGGLGSGNPAASGAAFRSDRMKLNAWLPLDQIGGAGQRGSALWGWRDPQTGREYALYGLSNGTSIIDVTDRNRPVYLGQMPTATGVSVWRELATYRNYLYVVSDGNGAHGVQILDLTRLRGVTTPQTWTPDARYTGVTNVHTITINEATGFAYLNGSNAGQQIVSLANPLTPSLAANFTANYVHDSLVVVYDGPDARFQGKEIAINSQGTTGLRIVDMTDKAQRTILATSRYSGLGYTHQGWLTEDQRFFIQNDELDENNTVGDPNMRTRTHFWDLKELDRPRYLGAFVHDSRVIDHNLFIKENLVYMSNYTDGLRVFDLSGLAAVADGPRNADGTARDIQRSLSSAAYFDTYPADDARPETTFNGQWGNYPFLPSGTILAGDRNNGLFLLSLAAPEPASALLVLGGIGLLVARRAFRRR
ncbi:MAG: choice-of-anchor B family protein [Capsulimonadales bacterium]|nr:choice-of-anchor B family protein [Capsulimonadales bacterium]